MPIFESPDKGETVYVREEGSIDRYLVKENIPIHEQLKESQLWGYIHREAKTNPTLQKALDRAIMIYKLSKDKIRE